MRVLLTIQTMSAMCVFIIVGSLLLSMVLDFADNKPIEEVSVELNSKENGQWPYPAPIETKSKKSPQSLDEDINQNISTTSNDTPPTINHYDKNKTETEIKAYKNEIIPKFIVDDKTWNTESYRKSLKEIRYMTPDEIVQYATDGLISDIAIDEDIEYGNRRNLLKLTGEHMLPPLDEELFAKLSMGKKHWESATPQQQNEFVLALKKRFVYHLSMEFKAHNNERMIVSKPMFSRKQDKAKISTRVIYKHDKSVKELWFMFYKRDSSWHIYDVIIDGIDLVKTNRAMINESIHQQGIDETIKWFSR